MSVPKLCGADIELGNFILGLDCVGGTGRIASRALLREIAAPYPQREVSATSHGYDPQDWGRKYLSTNASCIYVDLDHLELCLPEVRSAWDHVAAWHAMLRIARRALVAANAKLPAGQSIHVLVNNTDGRGNAYGSHLNFLVTRRAWDDLFDRKMHQLAWLASFQVSSIVFTGQGKVGAENGMPPVAFQLSQRADFFETLTGAQTTHRRPIVNCRDEALCGPGGGTAADLARLHSIFFDNTLCHGSSLLKVGTMQLVLAMLEADRVNAELIVDDPVGAVVRWSHDPALAWWERMASGKKLTAVELQLRFLEDARRFAAGGGFDAVVPRAADILALWEDTLEKLRVRDLAALAPRLDWVAKLQALARALARRSDLGWASPSLKHLDHLYGSLDPAEGLYWAFEESGAVERLVPDEQIDRFVHEPPDDTRAWTRAMLLRIAGPDGVRDVDWDVIRFRKSRPGHWPLVRTLWLDDPLGFTRATTEPAIERASTLDDILDALGASAPAIEPAPTLYDWYRASRIPTAAVSRLPAARGRAIDGNGSPYEEDDHDEVSRARSRRT
jgi:proteasome accessory factor A